MAPTAAAAAALRGRHRRRSPPIAAALALLSAALALGLAASEEEAAAPRRLLQYPGAGGGGGGHGAPSFGTVVVPKPARVRDAHAHAAVADNVRVLDLLDELPPVSTKRFSGAFVLAAPRWKPGDMLKMPKFLGKEGRERRAQRGKAVADTKLLKWDHIGTVRPAMAQMMPAGEAVREAGGALLRTCAVVGNGGGLLAREQGREIDAHDVVIRFNGGPVVGFEQFVGTRTTWRLTNYDHFGFYEPAAKPVERGTLQHVTNALALQRLAEHAKAAVPGKRPPPMFMVDPEFHYYAFNSFGLGAPSNGFYGTLLAGELCQQVTLYGFQKDWKGTRAKYHYYNDIEPNESQSTRDTAEKDRFQQWLDTHNRYARECAATPECTDPRVDKEAATHTARFRYGEQLAEEAAADDLAD